MPGRLNVGDLSKVKVTRFLISKNLTTEMV